MALLVVLLLALGAGAAWATAWAARSGSAREEEITTRMLAQAREALLAHAAERAIDAQVGPGYLPCPDRDGDGWAQATCGSLAGDSGQEQRLGWLPWKTLGLPDVRDGAGERPWYAVSTRHKGLLNCAASRACVDMSPPAALGTITVRDAAGAWLHDGRIGDAAHAASGGAAAVVIAPGAALARPGEALQRRPCGAPCPPPMYLDVAPGIDDNASFVDRTDARARNGDGFVAGPVRGADGAVVANDRIATVGFGDLMPRVMSRVLVEAAQCVRLAARRDGALPPPAPCAGAAPGSGRLPVLDGAGCNLDAHAGWWPSWIPHVLYAVASDGASFTLAATVHPGVCALPGDAKTDVVRTFAR